MEDMYREDSNMSSDIYVGLKNKLKHMQKSTGDLDVRERTRSNLTLEDVKRPPLPRRDTKRSAATNYSRLKRGTGTFMFSEERDPYDSFEFRYSKAVIETIEHLRANGKLTPGQTPVVGVRDPLGLSSRQVTNISKPGGHITRHPPEFVPNPVIHNIHNIDRRTVPKGAEFIWEPIDQSAKSLTPIFTPVARRRRPGKRRRSTIKPPPQNTKQRFEKLMQMKKEEKEQQEREKRRAAGILDDDDEDELSREVRLRREKQKQEREHLAKCRLLPGAARYFDWDSAPNTPETPIKSIDTWNPILPGIRPPETPPGVRGLRMRRKSLWKIRQMEQQMRRQSVGANPSKLAAVNQLPNVYLRRPSLAKVSEGQSKNARKDKIAEGQVEEKSKRNVILPHIPQQPSNASRKPRILVVSKSVKLPQIKT